jgi:signal transduction histidine kinase
MSDQHMLIVSCQETAHDELSRILLSGNKDYLIDSCLKVDEIAETVRTAIEAGKPYSVAWVEMRLNSSWNGLQAVQKVWETDPNMEIVIWGEYLRDSMEEVSHSLSFSHRFVFLRRPFDVMVVKAMAATLTVRWEFDERIRQQLQAQQSKATELEKLLLQYQKMAQLGEMTAGIAHELNHPLGVIQMMSERIEAASSKSPADQLEIAQSSKRIEEACEFATQVTRSVRVFSRNGVTEKAIPFSVQDVIQNTLALCSDKLSTQNIQLNVSEIQSDLIVECRPSQIIQVMLNLLNNAIDAQDESERKWIQIHVHDFSDQVEISVTNGGPSIPPEVQKKLFERFFTTKQPGKGTGLGLSLSQEIIQAHQGNLKFDELNKNSRFYFLLPKKQKTSVGEMSV